MRQVRTHADLQAFFRKEAAPLDPDQDVEAKIRNSLRIAAEDLDDARSAVGKNHVSSALNNLEEAMMICGETVAWAFGYKLREDSFGYHQRAIACLVLSTEVLEPTIAPYARRFQALREARIGILHRRLTAQRRGGHST